MSVRSYVKDPRFNVYWIEVAVATEGRQQFLNPPPPTAAVVAAAAAAAAPAAAAAIAAVAAVAAAAADELAQAAVDLDEGARHGLTLVHLSSQPEPSLVPKAPKPPNDSLEKCSRQTE